jgi:hypothetical protein
VIEYIKELISTIEKCHVHKGSELRTRFGDIPDIARLIEGFGEEMNRLDPRDFDPSARTDFVVARSMLSAYTRRTTHVTDWNKPVSIATRVGKLLEHYQGEGTHTRVRDFSFITDLEVKRIIERDYRELVLRTFPDGSWKSTVILAGSILEAVLYDLLTKDQAAISNAMNSPKAPKKGKTGPVRDIKKHSRDEQWTLSDLIEVASDLKILPPQDKDVVHQILREYRNFVHPRLEVKRGTRMSEGHATAAKGALDIILDRLTT